jgi:hypothetical protein
MKIMHCKALTTCKCKRKNETRFLCILLVTTTAYERGSPSGDYSVSREGLGCQKVKFKKNVTTHSCK